MAVSFHRGTIETMPLWPLLLLGLVGFGAASTRQRRARRAMLPQPLAVFRSAIQHGARILGTTPPPVILAHGRRNAYSDGQRVGVDIRWLHAVAQRNCDSQACYGGALAGVALHELAHHVLHRVPVYTDVDSRLRELEADFLAGWLIGHLELSAEGLHRALLEIAHTCGTHPTWPSRHEALRRGLEAAHVPFRRALRRHRAWLGREAQLCRIPW